MSNEQLCNGGPEEAKQCAAVGSLKLNWEEEAGVGIFEDCQTCSHPFGFHPVGVQGK